MRDVEDPAAGLGSTSPLLPADDLRVSIRGVLTDLSNTLVNRRGHYADIADNARIWYDRQIAMGIKFPPGIDPVAIYCKSMMDAKSSRLGSSDWDHADTVFDLAGYAILWAAHRRRVEARGDTAVEVNVVTNPEPCDAGVRVIQHTGGMTVLRYAADGSVQLDYHGHPATGVGGSIQQVFQQAIRDRNPEER